MMTIKEDTMPITEAFVVAAIVIAFVIFAAVLAWAEHETRHLGQATQQSTSDPQRQAARIRAKAS
jgi:multisubunit Na+/H+ antiporter MnhC subunit